MNVFIWRMYDILFHLTWTYLTLAYFLLFFIRCIAYWWRRSNKYLWRQHCFFLLRFQLMSLLLLTWNFNHVSRNFVHIPGISNTWNFCSHIWHLWYWNCFSSFLYCLVSPNLLYSSFLRWSSLWNAYCFAISFCSLFCLFAYLLCVLSGLWIL